MEIVFLDLMNTDIEIAYNRVAGGFSPPAPTPTRVTCGPLFLNELKDLFPFNPKPRYEDI
jgi:hypothetical protein